MRALRLRRRWRRYALATLGILAALAGGLMWYVHDPDRMARLVAERLAGMVRGDVEVIAVKLDWSLGSSRIEEITIRDPENPGRILVHVPQAEVEHPPGSLFAVEGVDLYSPVFQLAPGRSSRWTILELLRPPASDAPPPPLRIHNGTVRVVDRALGRPLELTGIDLAIRPAAGARLDIEARYRDPILGAGRFRGWCNRSGEAALTGFYDRQRLAEGWERYLPGDLARQVAAVRPNGKARLSWRLKLVAGRRPDYRVLLHLADGSLQTGAGPLERVSAQVLLTPAALFVEHLTARRGGHRLDGSLRWKAPFEARRLSARVKASGPSLVPFVDASPTVQGTSTLSVALEPEPGVPGGVDRGDEGRPHTLTAALESSASPTVLDLRARLALEGGNLEFSDIEGNCSQGRIRGRGTVVSPSDFRFRFDVGNFTCDDDLRRFLGGLGDRLWSLIRPRGPLDVEMTVEARKGNVECSGRLHLEGNDLQAAIFPYPLSEARGALRFRNLALEFADLSARRGPTTVEGISGRVVQTDLHRLELFSYDVPLDSTLKNAFWRRPRLVLESLHPRGQMDAWVRLRRDVDGEILQNVLLEARNCNIRHDAFPYRLEGLEGTMFIGADRVEIRRLSGKGSQGSRVSIDGKIWDGENDDYRMDLTITGRQIRFDDNLKGALGKEFQETWDQISPSGTFDLDARVRKEFGKARRRRVEVRPRRASFVFRDVPYRVDDLGGLLVIGDQRIRLEKLRGRHGEARIGIDGEIRLARPSSAIAITVTGKRVGLDRDLEQALGRRVMLLTRKLRARGRVDFLFRYDRPAGRETATKRTEISLDGVSLHLQELHRPIEGIEGRARLRDERIRLVGVRGRFGKAALQLSGLLTGRPHEQAIDLEIRASGLELEKELLARLTGSTDLPVNLSGTVNVSARVKRAGPKDPWRYRAHVRPAGGGVVVERSGTRFDAGRGLLVADNGSLTIQGLELRRGTGMVLISGEVPKGNEPAVLLCRLDRLGIDRELVRFLEPVLPDLWGKKRPEGTIRSGSVRLWVSRRAPRTVRFVVDLALEKAAIHTGARLEGIDGRLRFAGMKFPRQSPELRGTFAGTRAQFEKLALVGARLALRLSDGYLFMEGISAGLLDGKVAGSLLLDTTPYRAYAGNLRFTGIDLGRLSRLLAPKSPLEGRLEGQVELSGNAGTGDGLARGWAKIGGGRLWKLPILVGILDIFKVPASSAFHRGKIDFTRRGRVIHLTHLEFQSDPVGVAGHGVIRLPGKIDMFLLTYPQPGVIPRLPVFRSVIGSFQKSFLPVRVSGTLSDPVARPIPFKEFQEALD